MPDGPAISISHGFTRECSRNTLAGICSCSLDRRKPIVFFQSYSASLARRLTRGIAATGEALWWPGISHPIASIYARVNAAYLASLLCTVLKRANGRAVILNSLKPRPYAKGPPNRQTITLAKHAAFDPGQLLLDNEGAGLGGKQLQRRAITQRGFGLAQPSRGIRGLSSEDLLGAGRDRRDPDVVTYFSRSHWLLSLLLLGRRRPRRWPPTRDSSLSTIIIPQDRKSLHCELARPAI